MSTKNTSETEVTESVSYRALAGTYLSDAEYAEWQAEENARIINKHNIDKKEQDS